MSTNKFIFGLEVTDCEPDIKKYCIFSLSNSSCIKNINTCSYPSKMNPLCFCKDANHCSRFFQIVPKGNKIYILYKCSPCQHLLVHTPEELNRILEIIHSKYIFYGKDLDKLVDDLKLNDEIDDIQELITFLENIFKVVEN